MFFRNDIFKIFGCDMVFYRNIYKIKISCVCVGGVCQGGPRNGLEPAGPVLHPRQRRKELFPLVSWEGGVGDLRSTPLVLLSGGCSLLLWHTTSAYPALWTRSLRGRTVLNSACLAVCIHAQGRGPWMPLVYVSGRKSDE